jgi:hypothetical protein
LAREKERDPDHYATEYEAQFAESVFAFFPELELSECFMLVGDIKPEAGQYFAGVDQSGLSGRDQFGFAIAHRDRSGRVIVDCVRSWATKIADEIMAEIKGLCERYLVREVSIDRYGSGWVKQSFEKLGLVVNLRAELAAVYVNLKSLVLSGKVLLPDHKNLRDGLSQTEGYYSRSNSLSISHPRTSEGHGDLADAVATAVFAASARHERKCTLYICGDPYANDDDDDDHEGWVSMTGRDSTSNGGYCDRGNRGHRVAVGGVGRDPE